MDLTKPRVLVAALALWLPASGCFYPAERGKQLESRLEKLEAEKKGLEESLNRQKELLHAQIPKLDGQVEEVQKALASLDKAARRSDADLGVQLEQVKEDLNTLRGSIEQYLHRVGELEQKTSSLQESSEKASTEKASETLRGKDEVARKKAAESERPSDKKEFMELVAKKLESEPAVGRALANEFLGKWPKDPLSAKVHYQLGESFMGAKDWRAALAEFGEIVKHFEKSEQAPVALLKSADCFGALKMVPETQMMLETILSTYPKSDSAKSAKTRLAELKKAPAKGKK